jgi:hypothetical protein
MNAWLCSWLLSCSEHSDTLGPAAPEIDTATIAMALALTFGLLAIVLDHEWRGKR